MRRNITLIKLMAISVIACGMVSGFYLVRKSQFLSTKALTPSLLGGVVTDVSDLKNGQAKVDVLFKAGNGATQSELISSIALRLKISSKSGKKFIISDKDGNSVKVVTMDENSLDRNSWLYPVNLYYEKDNNLLIDFSALNTSKSGFTNSSYEKLFSFYIKGVDSKDDIVFSFDKDSSAIYSKRRPVTNIWPI